MDSFDDAQRDVHLSLKTLYKLLTRRSFLIDDSLPGTAPVKGMTLVKFWRSMLVTAFGCEAFDRLFDTVGHRSRNLTRLLNRTGGTVVGSGFLHEVGKRLNGETMARLIESMLCWLREIPHDPILFGRKLRLYIQTICERDPSVTQEVRGFIVKLNEELKQASASKEFFDAILLAWLTLHALYGNAMNDPVLERFRRGPEGDPERLIAAFSRDQKRAAMPLILSNRRCALLSEPQLPEAYVKPERTMHILLRALETQPKIALSGPSGIGKSEMIRQILRTSDVFSRWNAAAFVQYNGTLETSFAEAFAAGGRQNGESLFTYWKKALTDGRYGRVLLVIDGYSGPDDSELASWECDVLLTTRMPELRGFSIITAEPLDEDQRRSLFLRRCPGSGSDPALDRALQLTGGIPWSVLSLADAAHLHSWSAEKLLSLAAQDDPILRDALRIGSRKLQEHALPTAEKRMKMLLLFSILPETAMHESVLFRFCGDVTQDRAELRSLLQECDALGWVHFEHGVVSMDRMTARMLYENNRPAWSAFPVFKRTLEHAVCRDALMEPLERVVIDMAMNALHDLKDPDRVILRICCYTETALLDQPGAMRSLLQIHKDLLQLVNESDRSVLLWHGLRALVLATDGAFEEARTEAALLFRSDPSNWEVLELRIACAIVTFAFGLGEKMNAIHLAGRLARLPADQGSSVLLKAVRACIFTLYEDKVDDGIRMLDEAENELRERRLENTGYALEVLERGIYLSVQAGLPERALQTYACYLALCRREPRRYHAAVSFAAATGNAGRAYCMLGDHERACAMLENAYDMQRIVAGDQSPLTVLTLRMLQVCRGKCSPEYVLEGFVPPVKGAPQTASQPVRPNEAADPAQKRRRTNGIPS